MLYCAVMQKVFFNRTGTPALFSITQHLTTLLFLDPQRACVYVWVFAFVFHSCDSFLMQDYIVSGSLLDRDLNEIPFFLREKKKKISYSHL